MARWRRGPIFPAVAPFTGTYQHAARLIASQAEEIHRLRKALRLTHQRCMALEASRATLVYSNYQPRPRVEQTGD